MSSRKNAEKLQLAFSYHRMGNLDEAAKLYRQIIRREPSNVHALHSLGVIEAGRGNIREAAPLMSRSVLLQPANVSFVENYAMVLCLLGDYAAALDISLKGGKLDPANKRILYAGAVALRKLHRLPEALSQLDKILALDPDHLEALNERNGVLAEMKGDAPTLEPHPPGAAPGLAETWLGRGYSYVMAGRFPEALAAYQQAVAIKPDLAEAWLDLGNVLTELERLAEGLDAYGRSIELKPELAGAWLGRGNVFTKLKRHAEALAAFDEALALKPDLAEVWLSRGTVLTELGRYDEALVSCDKALALKPDMARLEGFRLASKMNLCKWDNFQSDCDRLMESVRNDRLNTDPFHLVCIPSDGKDQYDFARQWTRKLHPPVKTPLWNGELYRHDKIRIGYVSADFREHAVSTLMAGVFEHHTRSRFEVTAISLGPKTNSPMRQRLEGAFDHFLDAGNLSDASVAAKIRSAEIDILVDLMGFTRNSRTNIFAQRAAPIQVNYLGYPGTMGADYIDYIIADPTLIPSSHQKNYAEKVVYLPHTYMPHDANSRVISDRVPDRRGLGLPEAGFVFCAFNNSYKLIPDRFRVWMRLLQAVEGSVLWLSESSPQAVDNLRKEAANAGVAPERLVFAKRMPSLGDHLARHALADLFLDTLPYNAHATASDALWTGLPVLTQIGDAFPGRVAASLLNAIGLPELITDSAEAYERLALELATHPDRLAATGRKLAANRLTSPLFDTVRFTGDIEAAYSAMHDRHIARLPPDHIVIAG